MIANSNETLLLMIVLFGGFFVSAIIFLVKELICKIASAIKERKAWKRREKRRRDDIRICFKIQMHSLGYYPKSWTTEERTFYDINLINLIKGGTK